MTSSKKFITVESNENAPIYGQRLNSNSIGLEEFGVTFFIPEESVCQISIAFVICILFSKDSHHWKAC